MKGFTHRWLRSTLDGNWRPLHKLTHTHTTFCCCCLPVHASSVGKHWVHQCPRSSRRLHLWHQHVIWYRRCVLHHDQIFLQLNYVHEDDFTSRVTEQYLGLQWRIHIYWTKLTPLNEPFDTFFSFDSYFVQRIQLSGPYFVFSSHGYKWPYLDVLPEVASSPVRRRVEYIQLSSSRRWSPLIGSKPLNCLDFQTFSGFRLTIHGRVSNYWRPKKTGFWTRIFFPKRRRSCEMGDCRMEEILYFLGWSYSKQDRKPRKRSYHRGTVPPVRLHDQV